jgi:hypothetical protein
VFGSGFSQPTTCGITVERGWEVIIFFILTYLFCTCYSIIALIILLSEFRYALPLYFILQKKPIFVAFMLLRTDHTKINSSLTRIKKVSTINHI